MSYTPTLWVDGQTPVNAQNLNKLENAVSASSTKLDNLEASMGNIDTALDRIIEIQNSLIGGDGE